MIASPLRPRHRQESGIAAAGRLAHRGTPYGASLSFATTTHLWPLPDPPSRKPPQRNQPHWGPPGQFRAAPLPHQCRVPPVRVPGQDFHLRSQHPYLAHPLQASPYGLSLRDDGRYCRATPAKRGSNLNGPHQGVHFRPARGGALSSGCDTCRRRWLADRTCTRWRLERIPAFHTLRALTMHTAQFRNGLHPALPVLDR